LNAFTNFNVPAHQKNGSSLCSSAVRTPRGYHIIFYPFHITERCTLLKKLQRNRNEASSTNKISCCTNTFLFSLNSKIIFGLNPKVALLYIPLYCGQNFSNKCDLIQKKSRLKRRYKRSIHPITYHVMPAFFSSPAMSSITNCKSLGTSSRTCRMRICSACVYVCVCVCLCARVPVCQNVCRHDFCGFLPCE